MHEPALPPALEELRARMTRVTDKAAQPLVLIQAARRPHSIAPSAAAATAAAAGGDAPAAPAAAAASE